VKKETKNIVIFPKWKEALERESFQLLKEKEYETALAMFNELIKHGESTHEIIFGKLLCLAELEKLEKAIKILEQLIFQENDQRHEYIHMYLTMLYQTNEYEQLINTVRQMEQINHFPKQYREHIEQLYLMSQTKKAENEQKIKSKYNKRLLEIIETNKYEEQRHLIRTLKKVRATPSEDMFELLRNERIHPVIKTDLLFWFKTVGITQSLNLEKLGLYLSVEPIKLTPITDQTIYDDVHSHLHYLENEDPTLLTLIEKTFKRFLYVWYPFPLKQAQTKYFATALKAIVDPKRTDETYTNFNPLVNKFMKRISICEALYLSVIEE